MTNTEMAKFNVAPNTVTSTGSEQKPIATTVVGTEKPLLHSNISGMVASTAAARMNCMQSLKSNPLQNTGNNKNNISNTTTKTVVSGKSSNVKPAGENTGRWTPEEHNTFLAGLEQHGKEWKKIASMIETRTVVQIRTHAQKYFQKIRKTAEQEGRKDIPSDLTSTASHPRQKSKAKAAKSKRQSVAAATMSNNNRATKVESSGRFNNNYASNTAHQLTGSFPSTEHKLTGTNNVKMVYSGLSKAQRAKLAAKDGSLHGTVESSKRKYEDESGSIPKKLKISTAKIEDATLNDLKWFLAHNSDARLPDASPTSVADVGLFRFGGATATSSFEGAGDVNSVVGACSPDSPLSGVDGATFLSELDYSDEYPGSDNPEECVLSSLSCESDSMVSEWLSADEAIEIETEGTKASTDGDQFPEADTPSKYMTMDFHTLMEPLPELSLCSLSDWVASGEANCNPLSSTPQVHNRTRTASIDSMTMLSSTA